MIVSLCIPVHNRTYDLKQTMPYLIAAANASPPVEIVILDYNSPDDLAEYIAGLNHKMISYVKYTGRDHYHMAHARNLSVKASVGEYIVTMSADIYPAKEFIQTIREMLKDGYIWMHGKRYTGVIVCQRQEFMAAGGYDERFEFYGPEDTDLAARLIRRRGRFGLLPPLLDVIPTSDDDKVKNYRLEAFKGHQLFKREMYKLMLPIYTENNEKGLLVANEGQQWGQF